MKCCFCGAELEEFGGGDFPLLHYCDNTNCNLYHIMGQYTLWQALIDGKKAQDALNEIKETVDAFKDSEFAEDMRDCVRDVSRIITSITTGKDK